MGRQTAIEMATNAGASANLPLDPGRLPAIFNTSAGGISNPEQRPLPVEVYLDRETILIRGKAGDEPVNLAAVISAYAGVMVQITPADQTGAVRAKLILKHAEDNLSVVLVETGNPEELAATWPAWSKALGLPMLVCDLGGRVKPIEAYSVRASATPAPRRRLPLLTGRRPRFLVRRRPGLALSLQPVFKGEREIIARN